MWIPGERGEFQGGRGMKKTTFWDIVFIFSSMGIFLTFALPGVGIYLAIPLVVVVYIAMNLSHFGYLYPGPYVPPSDDFMNYFRKKEEKG
jgi:hypothetical protein